MLSSRRICLLLIAVGCAVTGSAGHALDQSSAPASRSVGSSQTLVPFTDHYQLAVAKPASVVWAHLKHLYIDGERARQQGYTVIPLADDPSAYLGGTMARQPTQPNRPFVKTRVSTVDEKAMLLTLVIDLENPAPVYVIHQVRPDGAGASVYQTIIQTLWPITAKPGETLTAASVGDRMRPIIANHQREVAEILTREKSVIEAMK